MTLLARLEAATGPDRELGALIHVWLNEERIVHPSLPIGYTQEDQGSDVSNSRMARSEFIHRDRGPAPHYTGSIDAALSWMPEGWFYRLTQIRFGLVRCELWNGDKSVLTDADVDVSTVTAPLAICIAIAKARNIK